LGRPSPRTQGVECDPVTGECKTFQMFGTQQLKYLDPVKPALGVTQVNTGQQFKGFTQTWGYDEGVNTTPFSQQFQSGTTGALIKPPTQPQPNGNGKECDLGCQLTGRGCDCGCTEQKLAEPCTTCDSDKCGNCNAWDLVCEDCQTKNGTCAPPTTQPPCDLGCLLTARGCDCGCKDVKPCTTCDSTVCKECNAWDLQCEDCMKKAGTCTPPQDDCGCMPYDFGCSIGCWWDKYGIIVMIIGGLIGLGFLLWLLRPLFSMIGAFKGGAV